MPCAARWVAIQLSGCSLPGATSRRTRSANTSAPPPGSEPEAGGLQVGEHLLARLARELGHVVDLGGREQLQVDVGQGLVQGARDVRVVVVADVRMLAADHVDLAVGLPPVHLDGVGDQVGDVPGVGALLAAGAGEGAELALDPAHVGVVQVQVVDEVHLVAAAAQPAGRVGELAQSEQILGLEQRDPVVEVEPLTGENLLADRRQRVQVGGDGHRRSGVYRRRTRTGYDQRR